ncbi:hypothetical protein V5799_009452 [Amblyomma americanum]|uniref:Peptidase M13 N-terminal domain-containing protein n=1 Tax=Amblyomma americanum TaxID=6943 RepID=A0AAQ4FC01_AMBAM
MKTSKGVSSSHKDADSPQRGGPAKQPGVSPERDAPPKRMGGPEKSATATKDAVSAKLPTGGASQKTKDASRKREARSAGQAPAENASSSKPPGGSTNRGGSPKRDATGAALKSGAALEHSSKQGGSPVMARSAQGTLYEDESNRGFRLGRTLLGTAAIATVTVILCVLMLVITWRVLAGPTGDRVVQLALLDSSGNDSKGHADPYEALFRDSVDTGASPCSNFYQYACGTWIRNHDVSSAAETWRKLAKTAIQRIKEKKVAAKHGQPLGQAAWYLDTCLNGNALGVDLEGVAADDVKSVLAEAGLTWPNRSERSDFVSSLFFMARHVALPVFFGIDVGYNENGRRALLFPLDAPFQRILRRFRQAMKTDHAWEIIRVAYETFTEGPFDGQRCAEVLSTMHAMTGLFEDYLDAVDKNHQDNMTSLVVHAPTVSAAVWGSLVRHYHKTYFSDLEAIVIYDMTSFAGIFKALQIRGEEAMNDLLGFLSVLAAVHYTNITLRDTFFGSADEAVNQQEQYCFVRAYKFYEHVLNHFLLDSATGPLEEFKSLVEKVRSAFLRFIRVQDTVPAGVSPLSQGYNLRSVFEGVEKSRPEFFLPHYARYLNLTTSALQNWIMLTEHLRKSRPSFSRGFDEEGSEQEALAGQCGTAFYKWRLAPCHLTFPWFVTNGHRGALLAGLGARIAAAIFLDYVDRNATTRMKVYQSNHACLRASTALPDTSMDLGLQASVAALKTAWMMYEDERASNATLFPDVGPVTSPRVFFLFSCHLLCGESGGPRMCNLPLRHSADFARVFACRREEGMNLEEKCTMLV